MTKNLNTTLKRRRRSANPMSEFDRLPPELRGWLAQAALPWSAQSVKKLWHKALSDADGEVQLALDQLSATEARALKKDAPQTWGASHPNAEMA